MYEFEQLCTEVEAAGAAWQRCRDDATGRCYQGCLVELRDMVNDDPKLWDSYAGRRDALPGVYCPGVSLHYLDRDYFMNVSRVQLRRFYIEYANATNKEASNLQSKVMVSVLESMKIPAESPPAPGRPSPAWWKVFDECLGRLCDLLYRWPNGDAASFKSAGLGILDEIRGWYERCPGTPTYLDEWDDNLYGVYIDQHAVNGAWARAVCRDLEFDFTGTLEDAFLLSDLFEVYERIIDGTYESEYEEDDYDDDYEEE